MFVFLWGQGGDGTGGESESGGSVFMTAVQW